MVSAGFEPGSEDASRAPPARLEAFFTSNEVVVATYGCSSITPFRCGE